MMKWTEVTYSSMHANENNWIKTIMKNVKKVKSSFVKEETLKDQINKSFYEWKVLLIDYLLISVSEKVHVCLNVWPAIMLSAVFVSDCTTLSVCYKGKRFKTTVRDIKGVKINLNPCKSHIKEETRRPTRCDSHISYYYIILFHIKVSWQDDFLCYKSNEASLRQTQLHRAVDAVWIVK